MRSVTTYIAGDGTEFSDEFECLLYEEAGQRAEMAARYFENTGVPPRKVSEYRRVIHAWLVADAPREPNLVEEAAR